MRKTFEEKRQNRGDGAIKGWVTRKKKQREWEDSIAEAVRTDERQRIRRELTAAIKEASERVCGWTCSDFVNCSLSEHAREVITVEDVIAAVDRICCPSEEAAPEEDGGTSCVERYPGGFRSNAPGIRLVDELLRLTKQNASLHIEFDQWEEMVAKNRFLESLADAAATWEGTREREDFEAFQALVHEWNNRNTTEGTIGKERPMDKIPKGFREMGIRLAVRDEGGVIRAYLALMDTMEGATPLATISLSAVHEDGGRDGELFTSWLATMGAYVNRIASRATGVPIETIRSFTLDAKPQA